MTETLPLVTVIMPVRNEAGFIARSLGAVLGQDYPPERLEVLVADGMSTDRTREIVRGLQAEHPNLRLIDNPGHIVSTALNSAFPQSRGDVIVWVGGHTEIAPDYVRRCVGYLQTTHYDCAGGPLETVADTPESQAIALAMSSRFGVGDVGFRTGADRPVEVDTVAFGAYRRTAMERCGRIDAELVRNQDDEYNYRLRDLGGHILLAPDIRARYYSRGTLRSLWSQYFQYGFWKVRVMQKHPRQMRWRHFVPPAFAAALAGAGLLALFTVAGRVLLGLVAGAYLAANLTSSMLIARRHGWRTLPLLPPAFATLHLSYGLGFLAGFVRFWRRWGGEEAPRQW